MATVTSAAPASAPEPPGHQCACAARRTSSGPVLPAGSTRANGLGVLTGSGNGWSLGPAPRPSWRLEAAPQDGTEVPVQLPGSRAELWRPPCPPSSFRSREGDRGSAAAELRGAGGGLVARTWPGGAAPPSSGLSRPRTGGRGRAVPLRLARACQGAGRSPGGDRRGSWRALPTPAVGHWRKVACCCPHSSESLGRACVRSSLPTRPPRSVSGHTCRN